MIFGFADYETGDKGSGVWALQANLTNLGFDTNGIDGAFGANTAAALRAFQAAANLDPTGVADEGTLIAVSQALEKRGIPPMDPSNYDAGTTKTTTTTTVRAYPTTAPPPAVQVKQTGLSPMMRNVALAAVGLAVLGLMSSKR